MGDVINLMDALRPLLEQDRQMNLKTYELTVECTNGDWRSWHIAVPDFHAAVENAMQSVPHWKGDPVLDGARIIRIEHVPERYPL